MDDIRVAGDQSDDDNERSPFKQNKNDLDEEPDIAPNNAIGATSKTLVAEA